MKNFNKRDSHGHHVTQSAANWRNTHTHMDRTQSLTHLQSTQLQQPRGAKHQLSYYFSVHAVWSFRQCFRNPPNSDMLVGA